MESTTIRSCEDILEAVKPLLDKHKCTLTISDEVREVCGVLFVEAIVFISDGKDSVHTKAQAGIDPNRKGMDIAQSHLVVPVVMHVSMP